MMGRGLTGNQLKLIALVTMTIDHIGLMLLPQHFVLRCIGRLALPIYAYLIAEGCRYTRSMPRYLGSMAVIALGCQIVYLVAQNSLYQCIMVTFSLSIVLIWLLESARQKDTALQWILALLGLVAVLFVTDGLPLLLPGTDYEVDYGFVGVLLPVAIYFGKDKKQRLLICGAMLLLLTLELGKWQILSVLSLPILAFYNGKRGSKRLKWFFYLYYPAHLVVLFFLGIFL